MVKFSTKVNILKITFFCFFLNNLIFVHNLNRKVNTGKQTFFTLLKNTRHI
jgi:hypothetical protein